MGFLDRFRTKKPAIGPVAPIEPLDAEASGELVQLTMAELAKVGMPAQLTEPGVLSTANGETFPLFNVARDAAQMPRREWPGLVRQHAHALAAAKLSKEPTSIAEAGSSLLVRVRDAEGIQQQYAPQLLPGLAQVASIDYPSHVADIIEPTKIAGYGGWDAVRAAGLKNLSALPKPDHNTIAADPGDPSSTLHLFISDDYFGAGRVLILDQVLAQAGVAQSPHGLLVAVPNRHVLLVHMITGAGTMMAINTLAELARTQCEGQAGPVSPHVFSRVDGVFEQVTEFSGKDIAVHMRGGLERALRSAGILPG